MNRMISAALSAGCLTVSLSAFATDINGDNVTDAADVEVLKNDFFGSNSRSDLNADGKVDFADLAIMRSAMPQTIDTTRLGGTTPPTVFLLPTTQGTVFGADISIDVWIDFSSEPTLGGGFDTFYDETILDYQTFEFDPGYPGDPRLSRGPVELPGGVLEGLAVGEFSIGLTGPLRVGALVFTAIGFGSTDLTMIDSIFLGGGFYSFKGLGLISVDYQGASVLVDGTLIASPLQVSFGTVIGVAEQVVTVTNFDDIPATIGQIASADMLLPPFFLIADACSSVELQPGASCDITIQMAPVATDNYVESFDIPSTIVNLTIDVLGQGIQTVAVDLLPGECPNLLDVSGNTVRLAILGSAEFDVNSIDNASIRFGTSPPRRSYVMDVGTPYAPFTGKEELTDCNDLGADGFPDLVLLFESFRVQQDLGNMQPGEVAVWPLRGERRVPTHLGPFAGQDVFLLP